MASESKLTVTCIDFQEGTSAELSSAFSQALVDQPNSLNAFKVSFLGCSKFFHNKEVPQSTLTFGGSEGELTIEGFQSLATCLEPTLAAMETGCYEAGGQEKCHQRVQAKQSPYDSWRRNGWIESEPQSSD